MTHPELKEAYISIIENLNTPFEPLLKLARQHFDPSVLEVYDQMGLYADHAQAALTHRYLRSNTGFDLEQLGSLPFGTLGRAYYDLVKVQNLTSDFSQHPALAHWATDSDQYYLAWRTLETSKLWRVVLGYDCDLFGELALQAFTAAQQFSFSSLLWVDIMMARVAFVTPEAVIPVYDAISDGWLRGKTAVNFLPIIWEEMWDKPLEQIRQELNVPPAFPFDKALQAEVLPLLKSKGKLPDGLPPLFWDMIENAIDPATITPKIAFFGSTYDMSYKEACARAILKHPGLVTAVKQGIPPRIQLAQLSDYPSGTLGYTFYHLIVDNNLAVDILDPESVATHNPVIDYTSHRILQTHDIWHLVAGYSTSPLHEVAISAFQLAQFGQNYSADFMATVMTLLTFTQPIGIPYIMQVTAEGWRHGRQTTPLMLIDWEQLWGSPIEDIRQTYDIKTFVSTVPDVS